MPVDYLGTLVGGQSIHIDIMRERTRKVKKDPSGPLRTVKCDT